MSDLQRPEVTDQRGIVSVLYVLMRDGDAEPGLLEKIVQAVETSAQHERRFSNGWLAAYAVELADRIEEADKDGR